jgi:hypothetical protein
MSKVKDPPRKSIIDAKTINDGKVSAWKAINSIIQQESTEETKNILKIARDNLVDYVQKLSLIIYYIQTRNMENAKEPDLKFRDGEITFINMVLDDFSNLCDTSPSSSSSSSTSTSTGTQSIFREAFIPFVKHVQKVVEKTSGNITLNLITSQFTEWSNGMSTSTIERIKCDDTGANIRKHCGLVMILLMQRAFNALLVNYIIVYLEKNDETSTATGAYSFQNLKNQYDTELSKITTAMTIAGKKSKSTAETTRKNREESSEMSKHYTQTVFPKNGGIDIHTKLFGQEGEPNCKIMFPFHLFYKIISTQSAAATAVAQKTIGIVYISGIGCYNPVTLSDQLFLNYIASFEPALNLTDRLNYLLDPHTLMAVDLSRPIDISVSITNDDWKLQEPRRFSIESNPYKEGKLKNLVCLYDIPDSEYKDPKLSKITGPEPHLVINVYMNHILEMYKPKTSVPSASSSSLGVNRKIDLLVCDAEVLHHWSDIFWNTEKYMAGIESGDLKKKTKDLVRPIEPLPRNNNVKHLILNLASKRIGKDVGKNTPLIKRIFAFTHFTRVDYVCFKIFKHMETVNLSLLFKQAAKSYSKYPNVDNKEATKQGNTARKAIKLEREDINKLAEKEDKNPKRTTRVPRFILPKQVCMSIVFETNAPTKSDISSFKTVDNVAIDPYATFNKNISPVSVEKERTTRPLYVFLVGKREKTKVYTLDEVVEEEERKKKRSKSKENKEKKRQKESSNSKKKKKQSKSSNRTSDEEESDEEESDDEKGKKSSSKSKKDKGNKNKKESKKKKKKSESSSRDSDEESDEEESEERVEKSSRSKKTRKDSSRKKDSNSKKKKQQPGADSEADDLSTYSDIEESEDGNIQRDYESIDDEEGLNRANTDRETVVEPNDNNDDELNTDNNDIDNNNMDLQTQEEDLENRTETNIDTDDIIMEDNNVVEPQDQEGEEQQYDEDQQQQEEQGGEPQEEVQEFEDQESEDRAKQLAVSDAEENDKHEQEMQEEQERQEEVPGMKEEQDQEEQDQEKIEHEIKEKQKQADSATKEVRKKGQTSKKEKEKKKKDKTNTTQTKTSKSKEKDAKSKRITPKDTRVKDKKSHSDTDTHSLFMKGLRSADMGKIIANILSEAGKEKEAQTKYVRALLIGNYVLKNIPSSLSVFESYKSIQEYLDSSELHGKNTEAEAYLSVDSGIDRITKLKNYYLWNLASSSTMLGHFSTTLQSVEDKKDRNQVSSDDTLLKSSISSVKGIPSLITSVGIYLQPKTIDVTVLDGIFPGWEKTKNDDATDLEQDLLLEIGSLYAEGIVRYANGAAIPGYILTEYNRALHPLIPFVKDGAAEFTWVSLMSRHISYMPGRNVAKNTSPEYLSWHFALQECDIANNKSKKDSYMNWASKKARREMANMALNGISEFIMYAGNKEFKTKTGNNGSAGKSISVKVVKETKTKQELVDSKMDYPTSGFISITIHTPLSKGKSISISTWRINYNQSWNVFTPDDVKKDKTELLKFIKESAKNLSIDCIKLEYYLPINFIKYSSAVTCMNSFTRLIQKADAINKTTTARSSPTRALQTLHSSNIARIPRLVMLSHEAGVLSNEDDDNGNKEKAKNMVSYCNKSITSLDEFPVPVGSVDVILTENLFAENPLMGGASEYNLSSINNARYRNTIRKETIIDLVTLTENLVFEGCNPNMDQKKFDSLVNDNSPVLESNSLNTELFAGKANPNPTDLAQYNRNMKYDANTFSKITGRYKTFKERVNHVEPTIDNYTRQLKGFNTYVVGEASSLSSSSNSSSVGPLAVIQEAYKEILDPSFASFENTIMPLFDDVTLSSSSVNNSGDNFSTLNSSILFVWLFTCLQSSARNGDNILNDGSFSLKAMIDVLKKKYNAILGDPNRIMTGRPLLLARDGGYYSYEDETLAELYKIWDYTMEEFLDIRFDCFVKSNNETQLGKNYIPTTHPNVFRDRETIDRIIESPTLYNTTEESLIKFKSDFAKALSIRDNTSPHSESNHEYDSDIIEEPGIYIRETESAPFPFVVKNGALLFTKELKLSFPPFVPEILKTIKEEDKNNFNKILTDLVDISRTSLLKKPLSSIDPSSSLFDKHPYNTPINVVIRTTILESGNNTAKKNPLNKMENCFKIIMDNFGIIIDPKTTNHDLKEVITQKAAFMGVFIEIWIRMLLDFVLNSNRGLVYNTYEDYFRSNSSRAYDIFQYFDHGIKDLGLDNPIRHLFTSLQHSVGVITSEDELLSDTISRKQLSTISLDNLTKLNLLFKSPLWVNADGNFGANPFDAFVNLSKAFGYMFFIESEILVKPTPNGSRPKAFTPISPMLILPEMKYVFPELYLALFPSVYIHNLVSRSFNASRKIELLDENDQTNSKIVFKCIHTNNDAFLDFLDYAQRVGYTTSGRFDIVKLIDLRIKSYHNKMIEKEKENNSNDEEDNVISSQTTINALTNSPPIPPTIMTNINNTDVFNALLLVPPPPVVFALPPPIVPQTLIDESYNNSAILNVLRKIETLLHTIIMDAIEDPVTIKLAKNFNDAINNLNKVNESWIQLRDVYCKDLEKTQLLLDEHGGKYQKLSEKLTSYHPYAIIHSNDITSSSSASPALSHMNEVLAKLTQSIEEKFKHTIKIIHGSFGITGTQITNVLLNTPELTDLTGLFNSNAIKIKDQLTRDIQAIVNQKMNTSIIGSITNITDVWKTAITNVEKYYDDNPTTKPYPQTTSGDLMEQIIISAGITYLTLYEEYLGSLKNHHKDIDIIVNTMENGRPREALDSSNGDAIDKLSVVISELFLYANQIIMMTYKEIINLVPTININPDELISTITREKDIILKALLNILKIKSTTEERQSVQTRINGMIVDSLTKHAAVYFSDNQKHDLISSKSFLSLVPSSYKIHTKLEQYVQDHIQKQSGFILDMQKQKTNSGTPIRRRICYICSNTAIVECGNCSMRQYCSERCSDHDWIKGGHARDCGNLTN